MLLRSAVIKLVVFAIIAVLGIGYTWYQYGGGSQSLPGSVYTVRLELAKGGGIFPNAEVTYRGVKVGTVGETRLTHDGLEVDLDIDSSSQPIPADVHAAVADLSAVGEQYVNLEPQGKGGPTLRELPEGERVIEQENTSTPPPPQKLLNNLNSLSKSVPEDSLRTVVDELHTGLAGTGSDLQQLLDSASSFTKAAKQHLPQTTQLLDSSRTVLDTQIDEGSSLRSFSTNLQKLASQLKSSDPDIRHVINSAAPAANAVDRVLRESGPNLSVVLANLLTTSKLLQPRTKGLELALVVYPLVTPAVQTVLHGNGEAHLGLALNFFNPPPCVRGYQSTDRRKGTDTKDREPNYQAYCAEPPGSPINVRGSENAPYKGVPVAKGAGGQSSSGGTGTSGEAAGVMNSPQLGPDNLAALLGVSSLRGK